MFVHCNMYLQRTDVLNHPAKDGEMGANMYTIYEVKNGVRTSWADCDILTYGMQICNAISQLNQCHMIVVNECDSLVMYDIGSHFDPDERLVII